MKRIVLTVITGPEMGRRLEVAPEGATLGRSSRMADLKLSDGMLSRLHCRFFLEGDRAMVQDLGSSNGTSLNGTPLGAEPTAMAPGDVVTVGETSNGKNTGMEVMGNNQSIGGYYYEMAGITFQLYNANGDTTDPDGIRPDLPAQEMVPDESGKIYRPFGKDEPLIAAAIEAITGVNTFAAGTRSATATPALRVVRDAAVQQSSPRRPQGTLVLKQLTINN